MSDSTLSSRTRLSMTFPYWAPWKVKHGTWAHETIRWRMIQETHSIEDGDLLGVEDAIYAPRRRLRYVHHDATVRNHRDDLETWGLREKWEANERDRERSNRENGEVTWAGCVTESRSDPLQGHITRTRGPDTFRSTLLRLGVTSEVGGTERSRKSGDDHHDGGHWRQPGDTHFSSLVKPRGEEKRWAGKPGVSSLGWEERDDHDSSSGHFRWPGTRESAERFFDMPQE